MKNVKTLILVIVALALVLPAAGYSISKSGRQAEDHAGHAHEEESHLDDLFDDEEEHAGHDDHAGNGRGESAHSEDLFEEEDEHAGHGHEEKEPTGHEGHGHAGPDGICPEHGLPEAEDALCQSGRISILQPGEGLKVRLAAPEAAERIGIEVVSPQRAVGTGGLSFSGRVLYNGNRMARVTPLARGILRQVSAEVGQQVEKGQILAEIASTEVASLRGALSTARGREALAKAKFDREKELLEKGVTSRQEFQEAEAEYQAARNAVEEGRQQMLNVGLAPEEEGGSSSLLPVRAPFAGTLVEKEAVMGEAVEPGSPLFTLADLSTMWIELSIPENQIFQVEQGASVEASFEGLPGRAFGGKVLWVASALDEKSRMLKAVAEVENPKSLLKSGLFCRVTLAGEEGKGSLEVPATALQSIDRESFVFVRLAKDIFEVRKVELGARVGSMVQVAEGLHPRDQVVVTQGFALKSEILKSRLGASCADH